MEETKQLQEKFILVAVAFQNSDVDDSIKELGELVKTAGGIVIEEVIQNRDDIHPATYVGKGKIEEIKNLIITLDASGIVCDDELSPAQLNNLEKLLEIKIIDRTMLVLDIFANRAQTKEGKIQVELAQLKYRVSRLAGIGHTMSRLGGGIGTRGPGEKKLEVDRRHIRNRIGQLTRELIQIKKHRELLRQNRDNNGLPVLAIVGYTNAGKSTLLNKLTGANVLSEDKLFATLDSTTRQLTLPSQQEVLLIDTVGFIRKLPHHLIKAFQGTLEEAKYADILLHVVDSSSNSIEKHMHIVYQTLKDLNALDKPIITVFNKQDCVKNIGMIKDLKADRMVYISALKQNGFDELFLAIEELLKEHACYIEKIIPYQQGRLLQTIRKFGQIEEELYKNEGVFIKAYLPQITYLKVKDELLKI